MTDISNWKQSIYNQLDERDSRLTAFFNIIQHYHTLALRQKKLIQDNHKLSVKLEESRSSGLSPTERIVYSDSSAELVQTLQKLTKIQDEYRDLEKALKEAQQKIEEMEKQSNEKDEKIKNLEEEIKKLSHEVQTYKNEFLSLNVTIVKYDEQIKALEREKNDLLREVLRKSQQNAELANKLLEYENNPSLLQGSVSNDQSSPSETIDLRQSLPKKIKKVIDGHKGELNCVAYNAFGTVIASGGTDKVIKLWDSSQGNNITTLQGPLQSLMIVAFSPDDQFILGSSNDNSTRLWLQKSQRVRHTLNGHTSKIFASAFTSDSQKVITGSHDRSIKIWDLTKGNCIKTIFCYSSCNTICLNSNGNMICSGHFDSTLRLWDIKTGDSVGELTNIHNGQITSVSPVPDSYGNLILTNSRDNTLKLVDIGTQKIVQTFKHENYINPSNWAKATISPDGKFIAAGSNDGNIYVWDAGTGKIEKILEGHKDVVNCVVWNPLNLSQMASCDKSGTIILWD